jgi:BirA family biotin operon repressor/biotin-[acetyl-CoA-carboxylase] ligase
LADASFDSRRFAEHLSTAFVGRALEARASTASTNEDAWTALAAGGPDGLAVVADEQRQGRGRIGRVWAHAPGRGLALSVGLRAARGAESTGALPLAAGLAIADALAALGLDPRLKWPNDVLLDGRKVAGVLCELRRQPGGDEAVVVGLGLNVRQREADFPPELRAHATSLMLAGADVTVEEVAARILDALEARVLQLRGGDRAGVLAAWTARAAFWGKPVTVRAPAGDVTGVALRLDRDGALVLRVDEGEWTAVAGDLLAGSGGRA